jgi:YHS domain-containing protein
MIRPALVSLALVSAVAAGCGNGEHADEHAGHRHGSGEAPAAAPAASGHELKKLAKPSASYPLKTCVISGDKLGGEMGEAIAYSYDGTEVQFCCPDCVEEFKKDPEKSLAQIRAAKK